MGGGKEYVSNKQKWGEGIPTIPHTLETSPPHFCLLAVIVL